MAKPSKAKTVIPAVPLIIAGAAAVARAVAAGAKRGSGSSGITRKVKNAAKKKEAPKKLTGLSAKSNKSFVKTGNLGSVKYTGMSAYQARKLGVEGPKRRTPVKKK